MPAFRRVLLHALRAITTSRTLGPIVLFLVIAALGTALSFRLLAPHSEIPKDGPEMETERYGAEAMEWMLAQSHYPYGAALPVSVNQAIHDAYAQIPDESTYQPPNGNLSKQLTSYSWEFMGPRGLPTRDLVRTDSGRVRSLEWRSTFGLRVGSATGGLWESNGGTYVCLTDEVSPFIGAFATDPNDDDHIVIGTGEPPKYFTGTGIYYTLDRGVSWTQASIPDGLPRAFYDIEFAQGSSTEVRAACTSGYFISHDGGASWEKRKAGLCFAMALHPTESGVVYAAFKGDGLYKSPDSGITWDPVTTPGYAGTDYLSGDLSICKTQPETLWFLLSTISGNALTTVLRTDFGGSSWTDVGLPPDFSTDQPSYNEAITVNPNDPDLVLVGGVNLSRSDDGGASWTKPTVVHDDHHVFEWDESGTELWDGSDGGVFHSTDQGQNFESSTNTYPITQFGFLSVCPYDPNIAVGGAQDNGVPVTTDGSTWDAFQRLDGGGVTLDPDLCTLSWNAVGYINGAKNWLRNQSADGFVTRTSGSDGDQGVDPNKTWYPSIETAPYARIYTVAGPNVYYVEGTETTWHKLNTTAFPDSLLGLGVERGATGAVYVTLANTTAATSGRIQVYRDGSWSDGDAPELPAGKVLRVVPHPTILGRAYAILNKVGYGAGNLFMTTDWGASYTDISGSLKSLVINDAVGHPDDPNQIFVATSTGVLWTPNGGTNWFTVNMGLPVGMDVRALDLVPTGGTVGEYWLYAGTYGRGAWRKLIPAPEPPRPPDVGKSVVVAPSGSAVLSVPDASGPSLDEVGATIQVQLLDDVYRPVPGVAANRITLKAWPESDLVWCPAPPYPNGNTDDAGITQFNLPLAAGGHAQQLQVCLDGVPIGGIISPDLVNLDVRCVDFDQDLNVGLLDFANFQYYSGINDHRVDYSLNGTVDYADEIVFETAMNSDVSCPSHAPNVGSTLGVISVFFDEEGTQRAQIAAPGARIDFYVIASKLPYDSKMRGFEFTIPGFNDPAVEVLDTHFDPRFPLEDKRTGPGEFRVAIRPALAPDSTVVKLMHGTIRLKASVEGLELRPTALSHSSFGTPGAPGWASGNPVLESHPFALVNSAVINPFPGELWRGLVTEALDAATLAETVGALELGGLSSAHGGMRIDLMGLGGGFAKMGTAGVDGAGIVFANSMPTANLVDGASLNWSYEGPGGNSLVTLQSTASSGVMTHQLDMSAVGSPTFSLNLTQNDQTVYSQSGFSGSWQCSEGLPSILGLFHIGGELNLLCDWGQDVTVSIGGKNYVGDQLILTSETGGTLPRGLFGQIHLTANDIPPIQIASFGIQRFNQIYRDLQNGYFVNTNASLEIVRPDWDTPASFLVERLDSQPVLLNFPGPDAVTEPDGTVEVRFQGGNTNSELKWTLHNGPSVQLETDFSGVGATGWTAQGFEGGMQQWQYGGSSAQVAQLERWPLRPVMTATGVTTEWNTPSVVTDPGNTSHPAVSTLQVDAVQPTQALPDGSRAQVSFSQMHELVLTEQQFSTATPPTSRRVAGLLAAYPNPFNPSTKIGMYLTTQDHVVLEIFDVRGRRVRRLLEGPMPAGETTVEWDGRDSRGESLASGIYFAHLVTSSGNYSEKLALVR